MKNESRIVALYKGGMRVKDIAYEYGVSDTSIRKILKRKKVKLRQCKYKLPVYEVVPTPEPKSWNVTRDIKTCVCKGEPWPECNAFPVKYCF